MASSLAKDIKAKLFEAWLPDKPGGLRGLIQLAAKAAEEAAEEATASIVDLKEQVASLTDRVEVLTESLHFAELSLVKEEGEG